MAPTENGDRKPALTADVASRLLDLLASDDDFRARFQASPTEALLSIGHAPEAADMPCASLAQLAPKETFAAARDSLSEDLVAQGALTNPHCFQTVGSGENGNPEA